MSLQSLAATPADVLVGTARQYIAKPNERGALKTAIAETQRMKRLLSSKETVLLIGNVGTCRDFPRHSKKLQRA